ncbi:MAG: Flagellar FliJ protein [Chlamydiales bacterium]|jgi:flagellar export protein FliJ|nr:Flagellar FliJ protein [Chlamydiales bacterium]
MKKFHFKLETLQKVRQLKENEARLNFEKAQQVVAIKQREVDEVRAQMQLAESDFTKARSGFLSAPDFSAHSAYALGLHQLLEKKEDALIEAKNIAFKKRQELEKAVKARKVLDKLHEKQYADWQKLVDQSERNFADEMAILRYKPKGAF